MSDERPDRVDIDATGRKKLNLGPKWEWSAAQWHGEDLSITMMLPSGAKVEALVSPPDFVWEE